MAEAETVFKLKVKSPKKPAVEIEVEKDLTIFDVKNVIHLSHYDDIPVENMRAVFKGKILDDDSTIKECNVQSGSTLIVVNMPDQKKQEVPASSSSGIENSDSSSSSPPDPNLFSNMLATLLTQTSSARSGGDSSASGSGFNWEALIPMFLAFANQIRGQVTRENIERFLQMPQVQAFAQQFKDLPSKAVHLLAQFYQSSSQFQSLVGAIKKGLMEAQLANASNLSVVVTITILLSWIDKFTHMAPREPNANNARAANNSENARPANNANANSGLDIGSLLGGLLGGASGASNGVDIGNVINSVLQNGMNFAQTMNNARNNQPPNQQQPASANQQRSANAANSPDLDDILDSVLDDTSANDDLETLD